MTRSEGPGPSPDRLPRDRNAEGRPENARPRDRFGAPRPRGEVDEMPGRVDPAAVCQTVSQALATAADLFDQQRFFEAHEFYEWAWKGPVTAAADRPFFKGMAQLAVGYCHTQRGNAPGARALLQRGIDHLAPFGPAHHGVDVEGAIADARRFAELLGTGRVGPALPFPSLARASGPMT
jgi:hypothetical protein